LSVPRIVVDANVIASALLKDSFTRKLLLHDCTPKLFAPMFLENELLKYTKFFSKKTGLPKKKIKLLLEKLFKEGNITLVPKKEYAEFMGKAKEFSPDPQDTVYFALALKLSCPIWSQDSALKKQFFVKIYSTTELSKKIELIFP
jgi:predicted nucleic acid-binding protein